MYFANLPVHRIHNDAYWSIKTGTDQASVQPLATVRPSSTAQRRYSNSVTWYICPIYIAAVQIEGKSNWLQQSWTGNNNVKKLKDNS